MFLNGLKDTTIDRNDAILVNDSQFTAVVPLFDVYIFNIPLFFHLSANFAEMTAIVDNVSPRDVIFAVAIYYTIHLAVNFTAIIAPASIKRRSMPCNIDVLESAPEIPDCAFPFLGKTREREFVFSCRNVKKNRRFTIARALGRELSKMCIAHVYDYPFDCSVLLPLFHATLLHNNLYESPDSVSR